MASHVQSYRVIEGDQTITVERITEDIWILQGGVIAVLEQNGRQALPAKGFLNADDAQTAAAAVLTALNAFLDACDAAAA